MTVADVMTQPVHVACLDQLDSLFTGLHWLQRHQIHRLPVVAVDGTLLGVITLTSLSIALETNHQSIQNHLQNQIQSLLEVQNRYEMMGMVGEQVLYEWDSQANQILWGGSTAVLGYSLAEMPIELDSWIALIHPDEREAFKDGLERNLRDRTPFAMEYRLRRKNGEYLWVEDKFQIFVQGEAVREVGFIADITKRKQIEFERRQAEQALQQKNQEFQAIFKAFPDLFFRLQGDGTILGYETRNLIELYAHPETFLNLKVQDILPHPAGECSYEAVRQAIETNSVVSYEYSLPLLDGDHHYEARMVRLQAEQVIAVVRDISDRKRIEETLRQREQEFRALAENSPDIIIRIDRTYRYVYVNPAVERETGQPAGEILGKTCHEFSLSDTLAPRWHTILQAVFRWKKERAIDYEVGVEGGVKYYASRIVPELAEDGSVESILVVARDVTQHKNSEERLRQQATRER
ncbi:MAG: PAS domain S-box protein [Leptolyngbyaceae cyanobacterium SL_7_1]|nr:PAS domain S-box protein [Leptolyngbyaceae cyanobacterium SL_7_1]